MDFLNNSNLHHAYLLVGRPEDFLPKLRLLLSERLGLVNLLASPDYIEESYSLFGIKDSHSLRQRQILSAFGQNGRFFVLTIDSATIEAQNALLKTFEEPTKGTHFFVILRSEDVFLPTLKSRFFVIRSGESRGSQGDDGMVASFLKLSPVARLEYVKKNFIRNKTIGKGEVFRFLDDLERELYGGFRSVGRGNGLKSLAVVSQAKKHLASPRSSLRLILENLALTI
ncbi:MAG TPA: hypothetical protein PLK71_02535 [Candidatus Paceibacterota bacterium]|jgi:hypothetical protein|nr:hypothetical protein [Candidatus Paceibacterota bacterium]HPI24348.1 hypothetical protein [Candidatus Paceibacterota bacterium]HPN89724.1 hypothetical protein [Candidatus Paceibacterota bacterium]HQF40802.1 hypothetical protein [Candidatus Paceibacterota bacterium]HQI25739.1 hypothetical protein [Candidatus Paceibacterota bacterium]